MSTRAAYTPRYTFLIGLMALVAAASLWVSRKPDPNVAVADVTQITQQAGDWSAVGDIPIDEVTMKQILADTYVQRRYVNSKGQSVDVLLVYRRYGRREFAHRPELCFPAAGFNIVSKDRKTLPYAGRDAEVVHLYADGTRVQRADGGSGLPNTTISYFFASGDRTECDFLRQQVVMAFERVIPNKNGWTFVRLTSEVPDGSDDAQMLAAQQDFMRAVGPSIREVITTDGKPRTASAGAPSVASTVAAR